MDPENLHFEQAELAFDMEALSTRAPAPKDALVIARSSQGAALTKEQKRFNSLVRRIREARAELERAEQTEREFHVEHRPRLERAEEENRRALRDLTLALFAYPARAKLGGRLRAGLDEFLLGAAAGLLESPEFGGDEELQAIFRKLHPAGYSFEEAEQLVEDSTKRQLCEMLRDVFGMDISTEHLDDPEAMCRQFEEFFNARPRKTKSQSRSGPRRGARAKSAKQLEAERRRLEAEEAVKKTTRQVYLDLVRHFHPDREQDEAARVEKTQTMQKITAAYEAGDHLRLLELQLTLLSGRGHAYADFEESHLRHFNSILNQQLNGLLSQIRARMAAIMGLLPFPATIGLPGNLAMMRLQVDMALQSLAAVKARLEGLKHRLPGTFVEFKKVVREVMRLEFQL